MRTTAQNFTAMKGHVIDGQEVEHNGRIYAIRNHIRGWMAHGEDGKAISGYLPSALDVEMFVVRGIAYA